MIVYKWRNKINGKSYIGKTSQSLERRARKDGSGYKKCRRFYEDIQEYGWPNFEGEVLEKDLTPQEAEEKEQFYIKKYDSYWPNGYNLQSGGTHCNLHEETKDILGEKSKGHKLSDASRLKMSESSPRRRAVLQFTKEGKFKAEYPMLSDAEEKTGVSHSKISLVCSGQRKSAGGYIWKYKEVA